jgi:hypothetical protein
LYCVERVRLLEQKCVSVSKSERELKFDLQEINEKLQYEQKLRNKLEERLETIVTKGNEQTQQNNNLHLELQKEQTEQEKIHLQVCVVLFFVDFYFDFVLFCFVVLLFRFVLLCCCMFVCFIFLF